MRDDDRSRGRSGRAASPVPRDENRSRGDDRSRARGGYERRSRSGPREDDPRDSAERRRKRRRQEDEDSSRFGAHGSRDRERSRRGERDEGQRRDGPTERTRRDVAAASAVAEARDDALRAKEANELDSEMEKRRKRVEAWQKLQRRKPSAAVGGDEAAAAAESDTPAAKKWSFEDEDSDEEVDQPMPQQSPEQPAALGAAALKPLGAAEEEVDPLDAFMAGNTEAGTSASDKVASPARSDREDSDDVDPLDAFMAELPKTAATKPKPKRPPAPKVVLKMDTVRGLVKPDPAIASAAPTLTAVKQVCFYCFVPFAASS